VGEKVGQADLIRSRSASPWYLDSGQTNPRSGRLVLLLTILLAGFLDRAPHLCPSPNPDLPPLVDLHLAQGDLHLPSHTSAPSCTNSLGLVIVRDGLVRV